MSDPASQNYFFIHVMKAGGTTLMRYLRENFELDQIYPARVHDIRYTDRGVDISHHLDVRYLTSLPTERRERIQIYTGHFPYVASELLGIPLTRITVLRHPVARTMSLLRQFQRKVAWLDPEQRDTTPLPNLTLEEVYEAPAVFAPLIHNHQSKMFSMTTGDTPETYMDVIDVDYHRLALAKQNLANVDIVGLTEDYEDFLDEVEARTGWYIKRGLRKNETPSDDVTPVSESLRRRIVDDNAIDMEFYEYAKELVALRKRSAASSG